MDLKACRVSLPDTNGVMHSTEVTASSLFEAIALGLAILRSDEWTEDLTQGSVFVTVQSVPVEHKVRISEFYQWIERSGGNPAEKTRRRRIKEILGIS